MNDSNIPLVSIVLCTYNGEKYLQAQLDSLIVQTYKNIEIIIVDDFSKDNTRSILSNYQALYPFIKVFLNSENIGFNKNFEKAIGLAGGEFVAICDQDDIWDLNKLEELTGNIGDKGVIFSNSRLIDENSSPTGKLLLEFTSFSAITYRSILINNFVTGHTILARSTFIKAILPFSENGYYDWWIGFVAIYNNQLVFLNKTLTSYRIHSSSVIQKEVSLADRNSLGLSLVNYKSCKSQIETFADYLKNTQENRFIKPLISLYSKKTTAIQRTFILMFLLYYYNILFPLHKRRKITSTTRFKIVNGYLKDVLECKLQVLGFI